MPGTTVKNGQSLLDIAIQQTGDVSGIAELALKNDLSITDEVDTGTALQNASVSNQAVVDYLKTELKNPATKDNAVINEGVDHWRIGIDFVIS